MQVRLRADMNVGSEVDASEIDSKFTPMMQVNGTSTTAAANLLVCSYGCYCRGGWWYHYVCRECRGVVKSFADLVHTMPALRPVSPHCPSSRVRGQLQPKELTAGNEPCGSHA